MIKFLCTQCGATFSDHGPGGFRVKFCKIGHHMAGHVEYETEADVPEDLAALIESGVDAPTTMGGRQVVAINLDARKAYLGTERASA